MADEIEAVVEENVLRTFKVLQEGKQDVPAFERAISQMLVYIRQGSVTNKSPQVLMSELNGNCNPTDNPLWTEFITGLCKTYQKFYNTNPRDSEMHEEVLGLMATAIGKAEPSFFSDSFGVDDPQTDSCSILNSLAACLGVTFCFALCEHEKNPGFGYQSIVSPN